MSIAAFLNSGRIQTKVQAVIDNTHAFLVDPEKENFLKQMGKTPDPKMLGQFALMDEYAPIELSDDFRVLEYLIVRNMAIASVIATGQEIPQTRIGQLLKFEGTFGKLAISHVFDEEDEIRMLELAKMTSMPTAFVDMLVGSVDALQPRIIKLANVLTWQAFYQGFVDFTDPRAQVAFRLRYNAPVESFPAPLIGSDLWSNPLANGIRNLQEHSDALYHLNGFYPDETVMSKRLSRQLLNQTSTRDYALSLGLISNIPGANVATGVDLVILNKLCERLDIPKIRIDDAAYEIEIAPNTTIKGRYLPDNTYAFVTKGMAKRLMGPTIEGKGKPGVFVKSEETIKSSPPQSRSYAVARMVPFIPQPKALGARKVA